MLFLLSEIVNFTDSSRNANSAGEGRKPETILTSPIPETRIDGIRFENSLHGTIKGKGKFLKVVQEIALCDGRNETLGLAL
jgi:hypothetical protein